MSITKPLTDAVYLPSKVPGYEHAYLINGTWEETWTYTACDQTVQVPIKFTADGFGGAGAWSQLDGKDVPGLTRKE